MGKRQQGRAARWCAVGGVLALAIAGCGGKDEGSGAKAAPAAVSVPKSAPTVQFEKVAAGSGTGLKLGYISAGEAVTFNHLVTQSMQREAKRAGARLVVCDAQADAAKALDCAKSLKTQNVQGYLLYQVAADAAKQICAAGPQVPVIGVSVAQEPCQKAFLAVDDRDVGFQAGRKLGEYFKQKSDCDYDAYVSVEYSAAGQSNTDRMGGYADGFASVCGKIHDKRKIDAGTTDDARRQFTDVLTTLPGRQRIIAVGIADFVIEGVQAAAKTAGRSKDVFVSAQGADPSAHCAIRNDPQWVNDAAYLPERWGQIGIPSLIRLVKGESVPRTLNVPFKVIDGSTIDQYYPGEKC